MTNRQDEECRQEVLLSPRRLDNEFQKVNDLKRDDDIPSSISFEPVREVSPPCPQSLFLAPPARGPNGCLRFADRPRVPRGRVDSDSLGDDVTNSWSSG